MGAALAMSWLHMCLLCAVLISQSSQNSFIPKIDSEECMKIGICEDVPDYPKDYVNKIVNKIKNNGEMWKFEKSDSIYLNSHNIEETKTEKEKSLCSSKREVMKPKAARIDKEKNIWQFVINTDDRLQPIITELCSAESLDHMCGNNVTFDVNEGYNTTCRQKYSYRQTLGLDHHGNVVSMINAFPSCCMCIGTSMIKNDIK